MKKVLFIVGLALLGYSNVNAQEVKFGAKAGVNLAKFSGDDLEDVESLVSFNVGAFAEISIAEKFIFQPELLYSRQGASSREEFDGDDFENNVKTSYLNVPLMIKFAASDRFMLELGPQVGFLLSAKSEAKGVMDGSSISVEEDIKDSFKSIDFGLNFGASFDIVENVFIAGRYNLGLSNIVDGEDSDDIDVKNSVFSFSLGYRF